MTTQIFQRPETIPIWAENKNWAGVLTDPLPAGIKITLYKPDGTLAKDYDDTDIDDKPMGKEIIPREGIYVFYYSSKAKGDPPVDDPIGWWHYFCKAVDGTGDAAKTVITYGGFELQ